MTILELIKKLRTGKQIVVKRELDGSEILLFWPFHYFEGSYLELHERKMIEETEVSSFDFDLEDETLIIFVEHI